MAIFSIVCTKLHHLWSLLLYCVKSFPIANAALLHKLVFGDALTKTIKNSLVLLCYPQIAVALLIYYKT